MGTFQLPLPAVYGSRTNRENLVVFVCKIKRIFNVGSADYYFYLCSLINELFNLSLQFDIRAGRENTALS